MALNIGKLLKDCAEAGATYHRCQRYPGSSNGRTAGSDPAGGGSTPSPGTTQPLLTFSRIASMGRAGTLYVCPWAYVDLQTENACLRRYTADMSAFDGTYQGPCGLVTIVVDRALERGTHRWSDAPPDVPAMCLPGFWNRDEAPLTRACSYCGAPGQRVSTRCEYCQVFVSKDGAR
jgi:hypothetical protein